MTKRHALITGASGSIGCEIYKDLLRQKYNVFVQFHTGAVRLMLDWADHYHGRHCVIPLQYDLTRAESRENLVEKVKAVTDRLDVLINCAGSYSLKNVRDISIDEWEQSLAINCTAAFHLTQLLTPLLEKAGTEGRVINIGDVACDRLVSRPIGTHYYVAKAGLNIVTRTFAEELAPSGVTVNMISPGFMENSIGVPPKRLPRGRPGKMEDVVSAVDYLLSPKAGYISGANITVSGGWRV